jgi:hypothetical protein
MIFICDLALGWLQCNKFRLLFGVVKNISVLEPSNKIRSMSNALIKITNKKGI